MAEPVVAAVPVVDTRDTGFAARLRLGLQLRELSCGERGPSRYRGGCHAHLGLAALHRNACFCRCGGCGSSGGLQRCV